MPTIAGGEVFQDIGLVVSVIAAFTLAFGLVRICVWATETLTAIRDERDELRVCLEIARKKHATLLAAYEAKTGEPYR